MRRPLPPPSNQEEPVRRRVALKVIKLGMDTKSVVARFEAERQALARSATAPIPFRSSRFPTDLEWTTMLHESLLGQTRATRVARQVGYREEVFGLLRRAHDLDAPGKDLAALRREAAASMGDDVGFRPQTLITRTPKESAWKMTLSPDVRKLAYDEDSTVRPCEVPSGRELGRWSSMTGSPMPQSGLQPRWGPAAFPAPALLP